MSASKSRGPIVVTGATGGLGSDLVRNLVGAGRRDLIVHGHASEAALDRLVAETGLPATVAYRGDLTRATGARGLREHVETQGRPPWALLHLVGTSTNGRIEKLSESDFDEVIATNLKSAFLVAREFWPLFRANGGGRIVFASSVVAAQGALGAAHYSAAKAALLGLARSLALEGAADNIGVYPIALGYFDVGLIREVRDDIQTKIRGRIPQRRFGTSREFLRLVEYILDEDSIYSSGQTLSLNGGLSFT